MNNNLNDNIRIPDDLEGKLSTLIDQLEADEQAAQKQRRGLWIKVGSIAASLAIICSVALRLNPVPVEEQMIDQAYTEEELAQEAQKALHLFAYNFNKGMRQVEHANHEIIKANQLVEKNIKLIKR